MDCENERSRRYRERNIELIRRRDRERSRTPHRQEYERRRRANMTPAQRKRAQERVLASRARYPHKTEARREVSKALMRGDLHRGPCEVCGTNANVEAHHDSYARKDWLNVRWMCKTHHTEHHQREREAARNQTTNKS